MRFSPYYTKIKVEFSPIKNALPLHNVVILIQLVLNKDKNHGCYKIFLEQCLYQLAKEQSQKKIFWDNNGELWKERNKKENVYAVKESIKI